MSLQQRTNWDQQISEAQREVRFKENWREYADRLEAAEALLRELRIRLHASGRRPEECWEMSEIDAHFARYGKD